MKTKLFIGALSVFIIAAAPITISVHRNAARAQDAPQSTQSEPVAPAINETAPTVDIPPANINENPTLPKTAETGAVQPQPTNSGAVAPQAAPEVVLPDCSYDITDGAYCITTDPAWWHLKSLMVEHKDKGQYVVTVAQADNPQVIIMPDGVALTFPVVTQ